VTLRADLRQFARDVRTLARALRMCARTAKDLFRMASGCETEMEKAIKRAVRSIDNNEGGRRCDER